MKARFKAPSREGPEKKPIVFRSSKVMQRSQLTTYCQRKVFEKKVKVKKTLEENEYEDEKLSLLFCIFSLSCIIFQYERIAA
ncbi:MAG: hypothetical protein R6T98_06950 [Desulfatiglandales bacterium]